MNEEIKFKRKTTLEGNINNLVIIDIEVNKNELETSRTLALWEVKIRNQR